MSNIHRATTRASLRFRGLSLPVITTPSNAGYSVVQELAGSRQCCLLQITFCRYPIIPPADQQCVWHDTGLDVETLLLPLLHYRNACAKRFYKRYHRYE